MREFQRFDERLRLHRYGCWPALSEAEGAPKLASRGVQARGEAEHIISTGVRVGACFPLFCSAKGRVVLSGRSDGEIRQQLGQHPIIAQTRHGLSTIARICLQYELLPNPAMPSMTKSLPPGSHRPRCRSSVQREKSLRR